MAKRRLRIAATADLHYGKHSRGKMREAFAEISESADVMLLCGDLTEYGLPEEAEELRLVGADAARELLRELVRLRYSQCGENPVYRRHWES